jgi:hypothetical protein
MHPVRVKAGTEIRLRTVRVKTGRGDRAYLFQLTNTATRLICDGLILRIIPLINPAQLLIY